MSSLLSSQIFLGSRYRFNLEAPIEFSGMSSEEDVIKEEKKKKKDDDNNNVDISLRIPQTELFDLFQMQRHTLLNWLLENAKEADDVMEAVVRVVTYTGDREKKTNVKARHWVTMQAPGCRGRFMPDTEIFSSSNKGSTNATTKRRRMSAEERNQMVRTWEANERCPRSKETFREWMLRVTTQMMDTELDIQLGQFCLKKHRLVPLHPRISKMRHFRTVFRTHLQESQEDESTVSTVQCAEVRNTTNRLWYRLVGLRHDIQMWTRPDMREMKTTLSRPFKLLTSAESWILKIVEPFRARFLSSASLWCPLQPQTGSVANLIAILKHPRSEEDEEKQTPKLPDVVKEIVVFRSPPTLHVYDVYEYGRRYFRTISYTSDTSHCLHDLVPRVNEVANPRDPYILSGGDPTRMTRRTQSLVITRNITASVGVQKFIPTAFLAGLVPSALLGRYTFWQSEDLSLTGYETENSSSSSADRTLLRIKLRPHKKADTTGFCNSRAYGCIRRYTVLSEDNAEKNNSIDEEVPSTPTTPDAQARRVSTLLRLPPRVDSDAPRLTLLNLLYVDPSKTFLCSLRKLLKRLDSLSHVLVWSSSTTSNGSVDLVELPRLRLRFRVSKVSKTERDAYVFSLSLSLSHPLPLTYPTHAHHIGTTKATMKRASIVYGVRNMQVCL